MLSYDEKRRRGRQESELQKLYGISVDDKEEMIWLQAGLCGICCGPMHPKRIVVDHDHETGKVRGVLCNACNLLIGWGEDNPIIIWLALNYTDLHT